MKLVKCGKIVVASLCMMATLAGAAMPALAISPAGCTSLAQIEEMNDDEEAQVQALKAAIAKVNIKYDEVQRSWQFDSPIYDKAEKNKTCCLSPWIFIFDGCKDVYFDEDFSYYGSSCIDLNTVYVRAGDNLYAYECDPDYTYYAYDTDKEVWWALSNFEMEPSEIDWLREMLSAKTIITRYSGASGAQYDYTWTADDRQAVTDMVNLYDLLVAASPDVRARALRG